MGFRLIRSDEVVVQARYLEMLESELKYYRNRSDSERNRADRLSDSLLIRNGELPATDLVQGDQAKLQADEELEFTKRQAELVEIYGSAMEEMEDQGLELAPEVAAEAEKLTNGS